MRVSEANRTACNDLNLSGGVSTHVDKDSDVRGGTVHSSWCLLQSDTLRLFA